MSRRLLFAVALLGCSSATPVEAPTTAAARTDPPTCDAGARPTVSGTCEAVGPREAPPGFAAAPDGWGFAAIKPAAACQGATTALLGQADCAPIDDCDAPFPPAGATVLHSGDDVGVAAARGGSGALLALDRGTYAAFDLRGAHVRVVGRCARDVTIKSDATTRGGAGVTASAGGDLDLSGVTVAGFATGASLDGATGRFTHVLFASNGAGVRADHLSTVELSQSVLDGSGYRGTDPVRALLAFHGSKVAASALDVREVDRALTAFDPGTVLDVSRSIVVASSAATSDILVLAMLRGAVRVHESYVGVKGETLINAGQPTPFDGAGPAEVLLERSVLEQSGGYYSLGLCQAAGGGTLTLRGSTVRSTAALVASSYQAQSRLVVEESVVAVVKRGAPALADLYGFSVIGGGELALTRSAVVGAGGVAVSAFDVGSRVTLDGSLVTGTTRASSATNPATYEAVVLEKEAVGLLVDSALTQNEGVGLAVGFAAKAEVDATLVDDTRTAGGSLGHGVLVMADGELTMKGAIVRGSADAALVVLRAKGDLAEVRVLDSPLGVSTWETKVRQGGAPPDPRELRLVGVTFERTATPLAEGEVATTLPKAPPPPTP